MFGSSNSSNQPQPNKPSTASNQQTNFNSLFGNNSNNSNVAPPQSLFSQPNVANSNAQQQMVMQQPLFGNNIQQNISAPLQQPLFPVNNVSNVSNAQRQQMANSNNSFFGQVSNAQQQQYSNMFNTPQQYPVVQQQYGYGNNMGLFGNQPPLTEPNAVYNDD